MFRRLFHRRRVARPLTGALGLPSPTAAWPGSGLHVCPQCRMSFVHPVEWEILPGGGDVRLVLRCGECGTWQRVEVSVSKAERFSRDVERARTQLVDALRRLEQARLAIEADILATALDRDLIDAADFRPPR